MKKEKMEVKEPKAEPKEEKREVKIVEPVVQEDDIGLIDEVLKTVSDMSGPNI
jgi:hypothetical protein